MAREASLALASTRLGRHKYAKFRAIVVQFSDDLGSSLTPSSPRNSIPCSSKVRRIALRFRPCIASVPSTLSPREIADRETRQRLDRSRTDHLSNARAARSWAPLIGELEIIRLESPLRQFLYANPDKTRPILCSFCVRRDYMVCRIARPL